MVDQKWLIFWLLLSSALHLSLFMLAPKPDILVSPRPIHLVVDLIAGSGADVSFTGSPSKGRLEDKKQGLRSKEVLPATPAVSTKPVEKPSKKTAAQPERTTVRRKESGPVQERTVKEPLSAERSSVDEPLDTRFLSQTKGDFEGDPRAETDRQGRSGPDNGSSGGGSGSAPSSVSTPLAYGTNPPPPYPLSARRHGWEGEVVLLIDVSAGGLVRNVSVEKSSGFSILDEAAQKAVYQWHFNPARQNGRPVPGQVIVPVRFSLTEAG